MANTYVSKVIYGNDTLIDLTSDTVVANKLLSTQMNLVGLYISLI